MTYDQALRELTRLLGVPRSELEPLLRAVVLQMPLRAEDGTADLRGKTLGEAVAPGRLSAHRFTRWSEPSTPRPAPTPIEIPPSVPRASRGEAAT